jgi:hypothetical protein
VNLTTKVTQEYLRKAFEFSVQYHLNPSKTNRSRTSGQERSLGEIVDSFISGKVIELGVIDILKKINSKKKYFPDLEVRSIQEFDDPDIISIIENRKKRLPKIFVEIKNDLADYRWTGLYKEQFETIQTHKSINKNLEKIFLVYASIQSKENISKGKKDLFGIFLKSITKMDMFKDFILPKDLYIEINHVITGKELVDNGDFFNKNKDFIFETDVLRESNLKMIKKDGTMRKGTKKISHSGKKLPVNKIDGYNKKLGDFIFEGEIETYKVKFGKSYSLYIKCISDVVVQNRILGKFKLICKKQYQLINKELMPCGRNNLWIAKRNLNFVTKSNGMRMRQIAKNI